MSESNDTSAIDEKKIESEGGTTNSPNYGKFVMSLFIIVFVLIYFGFSSFILYGCKIAQSNVLPTDTNCYPYTENKPNVTPIETNIFTTLFTEKLLSMKLNIPYDINSKISILDTIRQYKNSSSSNFLVNYFIAIFEALVSANFSIFNYLFNGFNQLPEIITVLLGPIILGFIMPLITLFNCLYGIYLWFANMSWFFKTKSNTDEELSGKSKWDDVSMFANPINYGFAIGLIILFTIVLFIAAPYIWFTIVSMFFVFLTIASYKGRMNNKNVGLLTVFSDILKFYKISIMTIICICIISSAFVNLGTTSGIICVGVLLLIWYGLISVNLFNTINPDNLTPLVSDEQAIKSVCASQKEKKQAHGLLYNWVFGQNGGNINKELKKLNKNK